MTDHLNYGWRSLPLWCLYDLHWAQRLKQGGYSTIGDVCDASPEALAKNVFAVGPKRAVKLRQKALDFIASKTPAVTPMLVIDDHYDPRVDETTPTLWDTVLTIGGLLIIGALFGLTAWWLL